VNTEPLPGASTSWVRCNPYLGILKDGRERGAAAVREGIRAALTIVRDEPSDRHGLHRPCGLPIAAWSMRVAAQNKMTRSCAVSFVVSFSMAYSRRQLLGNAAIAASRAAVSNCSKPTLYSITSSARASSVGGTSMPSASAVFE
jgi:hypothetical protein